MFFKKIFYPVISIKEQSWSCLELESCLVILDIVRTRIYVLKSGKKRFLYFGVIIGKGSGSGC